MFIGIFCSRTISVVAQDKHNKQNRCHASQEPYFLQVSGTFADKEQSSLPLVIYITILINYLSYSTIIFKTTNGS